MLNNVATAKREFSMAILRNFVERKAYVSSHFFPHPFPVSSDVTIDVAQLKFELGPTVTTTTASWEGKVPAYMPRWQSRAKNPGIWQTRHQMDRDTYDILFNRPHHKRKPP